MVAEETHYYRFVEGAQPLDQIRQVFVRLGEALAYSSTSAKETPSTGAVTCRSSGTSPVS